ncbi:Six-bladed beta-propeller, TolB-like [Sergentomyia squamirostris]
MTQKLLLVFFVLIITQLNYVYPKKGVQEVYKWKNIKFENLPLPENTTVGPYPYYIPENNNIMQMGYHPQSGIMLVTVARLRPGVPITLGAFCTDDYSLGSSPAIWAFPDYESNTLKNSDFENYSRREYYNPDTGTLKFGLTNYVVQKPAIMIYNLPPNGCKTRVFHLIRKAEFPEQLIKIDPFGTLYMTLDPQSHNCDDIFIYFTNVFQNYLAVYSYKENEFWYFKNQTTFQPVQEESYLTDESFKFFLPLGVVSVALDHPDKHGDRIAYYMPSASGAQYAVNEDSEK